MKLMVSLFRGGALLLLALACGGCPQDGQNQSADEEKEPHFIEGRRHVIEMDYHAAIESFEKALSVNRLNASAHWELASLYTGRTSDPAAAIYHYERFLKLRPTSGKADTARQQIQVCKMDLARTVSLGPVTEKVQRDLERLVEENKRLTEENRRFAEELRKVPAARPPGSPAPQPLGPPPAGPPATSRPPVVVTPQPPTGRSPAPNPAPNPSRSHVILAHETLGSIARQYGIKVEALMAANPGVDSRHLRPGQRLNVPR